MVSETSQRSLILLAHYPFCDTSLLFGKQLISVFRPPRASLSAEFLSYSKVQFEPPRVCVWTITLIPLPLLPLKLAQLKL